MRAGLVMRQIHHWAALLFLAAIVVHLARVFFTGAFRRPRELNWIIGVTLLILAIVNGFAGYSLLDDQLSGTGLRIAYSIALSIPVVGTWLASLLFGGEFPGDRHHHPALRHPHPAAPGGHRRPARRPPGDPVVRQKHTQFPGPGRAEDNVVGERLWPTYAVKAVGLFFLVAGVLAALGGLVQINPIWLYGPFDPAEVSAPPAPARLVHGLARRRAAAHARLGDPGLRLRASPTRSSPACSWPASPSACSTPGRSSRRGSPGPATSTTSSTARATRPVRTALGVATLELLRRPVPRRRRRRARVGLQVAPESVTDLFRLLVFVVPVIAFVVTRSACRSLARDNVHPVGGSVGSASAERRPAATRRSPTSDEAPSWRAVAADDPYREPPSD